MTEPNLRDTFGNLLTILGKEKENIVVLDADLSTSTRTHMFAEKFPQRFFNMGIAEQNMIGTALGFAISGKIPIVSGFTIFTIGRAWEFIRLACHDNLNIKIITTHSGFVGEDGSTHHALEDLSLMASLNNLNILVPADNIELIQMLNFAINSQGPFYIRLPRSSFQKIHEENYQFTYGIPDLIKDGQDICLIGTGYGSILAAQSAMKIQKKFSISVKVLNISTIKPINTIELIKQIKNVKGIVIIEEHNIYCGFGSILARIISENSPKPIKFIGIENSYGESGERKELLEAYGLNTKNILKQVDVLLKILK